MPPLIEDTPEPVTGEVVPQTPETAKLAPRIVDGWLRFSSLEIPSSWKLISVAYSLTDQALAVGGGLLVNVALARTQSREEYGMFVLSYSVYTLLVGLYHAAILEPYTIYGSGRYREHFSEYLRLMVRSNAVLVAGLTGGLLLAYRLLSWIAPQMTSSALLGLALTAGILLSGHLLRRAFYLQHQAAFAVKVSCVFFLMVAVGIWVAVGAQQLNGFTVFLILAVGWIVAALAFGRNLAFGSPQHHFLSREPGYWREHWRYSKWVLATAFVFQFTTQGYYWIVAGFLSAKEVADLRAMSIVVMPTDQIFIALSFVVIPALSARYATRNMGSFLSVWKRYLLGTLGVTGLFVVLVRTIGKSVMHILYAGRYDGLAPYLFVLILLPVLMGIGGTLNNAVIATERPKFVFIAYLSGGVVTFLVGVPLVMHFGLWGAVYGMLLSGAAYTVTLAIAFALRLRDIAKMQTA